MMRTAVLLFAMLAVVPAAAQTTQPYSGQQDRAISALSEKRIEGLRTGRGLGYAKAAELNGWPGPMHVLELEDLLDLDPEVRAKVEAIRAEMLSQSVPLGEELIEAEMALDKLFTDGTPEADAVHAATLRIGEIESRLRAAHLVAHVKTRPLLTDEQRAIYARERGYGRHHGKGHDGKGSHGKGHHQRGHGHGHGQD